MRDPIVRVPPSRFVEEDEDDGRDGEQRDRREGAPSDQNDEGSDEQDASEDERRSRREHAVVARRLVEWATALLTEACVPGGGGAAG